MTTCKRAGPECHRCGNTCCCGCLDIKACCGPCQYARLKAKTIAHLEREGEKNRGKKGVRRN